MNSYGSRAAFEELSPDRALDGLALPSGAVPEETWRRDVNSGVRLLAYTMIRAAAVSEKASRVAPLAARLSRGQGRAQKPRIQ